MAFISSNSQTNRLKKILISPKRGKSLTSKNTYKIDIVRNRFDFKRDVDDKPLSNTNYKQEIIHGES